MNKKSLEKAHCVRIAGKEHVRSIVEIYRLVQIEPALFLDIAKLRDDQAAPLHSIKALGGFISPPDERDMELTMQHGLILVLVQNGEVAGYNRVTTRADKVHQELCAEFQIDQSLRAFDHDRFTDWSGNKEKRPGKSLKCIHWIDREQALLAFNAAIAGLEGKHSGKLAWAVDTAVHPKSRNMGVARALIDGLNRELRPEFQFRAFRIFEILKINDTDISFSNTRSEKTFIDSTSRRFAYTEEDVVINSTLTLRVRWNHWLRHI